MSTYEVVHPKLRLRTNDGLTRQAVGSHIEMDDKHAKNLVASGKIKKAEKKTVSKVGKADDTADKVSKVGKADDTADKVSKVGKAD